MNLVYGSNISLVDSLKRKGFLKSSRLVDAFIKVDRRDFVPVMFRREAYLDIALPTLEGQTISQPQVVAFMLSLLDIQVGDKVLDIGAGSGWVVALAAYLVGNNGFVRGYELKEGIGRFGQENLLKYPFRNYSYSIGDAKKIWSKNAPYDRVISGAAFPYVDEDFYKIIKNGGSAVIPTMENEILLIKKSKSGKVKTETFYGFMFVPLV